MDSASGFLSALTNPLYMTFNEHGICKIGRRNSTSWFRNLFALLNVTGGRDYGAVSDLTEKSSTEHKMIQLE